MISGQEVMRRLCIWLKICCKIVHMPFSKDAAMLHINIRSRNGSTVDEYMFVCVCFRPAGMTVARRTVADNIAEYGF